MATLFENATLLDVEAGVLRPGTSVLRREAMPAIDVIRSATLVNAALLQRTGELGVVKPGALADLLLVDGDPLRDITLLDGQGEHLLAVMRGGEIFHRA
jgi:imidazolonepropionase-like amidohydrolase